MHDHGENYVRLRKPQRQQWNKAAKILFLYKTHNRVWNCEEWWCTRRNEPNEEHQWWQLQLCLSTQFCLNTLCKVEGQLEGSKQQNNRYHVSSSFNNNIFIQQLVYISSGHSTHNANCYITLSSLKMCALGFYLAEMKWWFRSAPQSCEHVVPWCPSLHHIKKNVKECSLNQSYYNMTPVSEHTHLFVAPRD